MTENRKPTPENPNSPEVAAQVFGERIDAIFDDNIGDFEIDDETFAQRLDLLHETDTGTYTLLLDRYLNPDTGEFIDHGLELTVYDSEGEPKSMHKFDSAGKSIQRSDDYFFLGLHDNPSGYTVNEVLDLAEQAALTPVHFNWIKGTHLDSFQRDEEVSPEDSQKAATLFDHFIDDMFSQRRDDIIQTVPPDRKSIVEKLDSSKSNDKATLAITLARETRQEGIVMRAAGIAFVNDNMVTYMNFSSERGRVVSTCKEKYGLEPSLHVTEAIMKPKHVKQLGKFITNPRID